MRFYCDVEVQDRAMSYCVQRRLKSILAFTRKSITDNEVCLYLQTRQNMRGTRYQIAKNIEHVFTKFLNTGKITIRLTQPSHDLIIQSDAIQLGSFLYILNYVRNTHPQNYNSLVKQHTLMFNTSFKSSDFCLGKVKTKVVVKTKSEYPTLHGFPRTTEHLVLKGLDRRSFDRQILRLHSLRILDLSNNKISYLPKEIGTLPLQQLFLSQNNLGESPRSKWAWLEQTTIKHSLQFLDISSNLLTELPIQIKNSSALINLKVSQNMLKHLPHDIKTLQNLKILDVARNQLLYLPITILNLQLQFLDVTENPFTCDTNYSVYGNENTTNVRIPSLVEWSAKRILKSRIRYDVNIIPHILVEYLDEAKRCYHCATFCFDDYVKKLLEIPVPWIEIKQSVGTSFKFETYFCSLRCTNNFL